MHTAPCIRKSSPHVLISHEATIQRTWARTSQRSAASGSYKYSRTDAHIRCSSPAHSSPVHILSQPQSFARIASSPLRTSRSLVSPLPPPAARCSRRCRQPLDIHATIRVECLAAAGRPLDVRELLHDIGCFIHPSVNTQGEVRLWLSLLFLSSDVYLSFFGVLYTSYMHLDWSHGGLPC